MAWMSPNMLMETTTNGGIGKAFGRMFSREHMFQNIYTAQGGPGMIAFASSFPGSVRAFQIAPGQKMILQKSAFLAGEGIFNTVITGPGRVWLQTMPISNVAGALKPYSNRRIIWPKEGMRLQIFTHMLLAVLAG